MAAAYVQQSESESFKDPLPRFGIRSARPSDIPLLERVERSAAEIFRTVGLDHLLDGDMMNPSVLAKMAAMNHLWIAVNDWDQPIGFLGGHDIEGKFHLAEVSVAREFQGRGVGRALMATMVEQAQREGYKAITLTTFRNVPWNGPWYRRLGFSEVDEKNVDHYYLSILENEAEHGLDRSSRCVMHKLI
ncbi:putative acetyltransferase [Tricladium varicosporioides]|nr:putative acetyltransferase [Hymenoscyphus varicosporioides]